MNEQPSDSERALGAVSYVGPLWIGSLIAKPGSEFCRFHARQGIALFLTELVAAILLGIVRLTSELMPVGGTVAVAVTSFAVWTSAFLLSLACISSAVKGERWRIPILADYADVLPL